MATRAPKPRKTKTPPTAEPADKALAQMLAPPAGKPSALLDTRVIYCGDCLEQLKTLPGGCVDLIYIDPPFGLVRPDRLIE
jgi:hypothetical protein